MGRNPFNGSADGSSSNFDRLVADAMNYWHAPGLAVAIVDDKDIVSKGYGVTRLKNDDQSDENEMEEVPVTPETLFDIASMSKSFTAAAMALLVEDEELKDVSWRTPVSKLCSDFVFENEFATENLSVEDILSHRSGLPGHDEFLRSIRHNTPDTPASLTRNLRNLPFTRPIRTEWQYSNTLYTAAAHLVETLSHTDFENLLRSRFWTPLDMRRTYLGLERVPASESNHVAHGYVWLREKAQYKPLPHYPEPEGMGAGSIISNVEDVARWIRAFIHRAPPLSDASYTELATPRILESKTKVPRLSPTFYALGWEVSYYHGHAIIQHGGLWAGFSSLMLYIPSKEWGFVMMGNTYSAGEAIADLQWYLVDEVLGIPAAERFDWRSHLQKADDDGSKADSKEDLYPELREREGPSSTDQPDLEPFAGTYRNKGYHEIVLKYNSAQRRLEVDCSDRSFQFRLAIKEHAYEHWFVADMIYVETEDKRTMRCKFECNEEGECQKVGLGICEELDGLIWFEKVAAQE